MNTAFATLEQVLEFRDERWEIQRSLLAKYGRPLISFTMNIAGPHKRTRLAEFVFNDTVKKLVEKFGEPLCYKELRCTAGCEAFLVYEINAGDLKLGATEIEEALPVGRLLDIDVLGTDGIKLSRQKERSCLICSEPAGYCARSRRHSLRELEDRTREILAEYMVKRISELAVGSLLEEVRLTPKPGLVDRDNAGAHRDMDISLMENSAHSLKPFFELAARLGYSQGAACSSKLQDAGICAEKTMFETTRGVNTHKGAIFSLGLLCAAAGEFFAGTGDDIRENAAALAAGLRKTPEATHGEQVRKKYSAGGARAEALEGFPHVELALRVLEQGGGAHAALLTVMSELEDSNLLWRGGSEGLEFVRRCAAEILKRPETKREEMIRRLDQECIRRNLSPGGSADLLADALFLHGLSAWKSK